MTGKNRPYRIGIVANFSDSWSAGRYYVENILCALLDTTQPYEITAFSHDPDLMFSHKITRPEVLNVKMLEPRYTFIERFINTTSRAVMGRNIFEKRVSSNEFDIVFPVGRAGEYVFAQTQKIAFWIPDFQECHYPENFDSETLQKRKDERSQIIMRGNLLVLSSQAAFEDLKLFFPGFQCEVIVLPFAVYNPLPPANTHEAVLEKFGVEAGKYFICPNQFWKHKNHRALVEAAAHLKASGAKVPTILLTGKEAGFAGEGSANECRALTEKHQLSSYVHFLGFIDREDLLVLIKYSIALLQPSLFEGWNTSIEDAKSLDVAVIASAIDVHKEQLPEVDLVDPLDPLAWASALTQAMISPPKPHYNYAAERAAFQANLHMLVTYFSTHGER